MLRAEGALKGGGPKRRGFVPVWSGNVLNADSLSSAHVTSGGKRYKLTEVLPVDIRSKQVNIPLEIATGSELVDATMMKRLREPMQKLQVFMDKAAGMRMEWPRVKEFLKKHNKWQTFLTKIDI